MPAVCREVNPTSNYTEKSPFNAIIALHIIAITTSTVFFTTDV